MLVGVLVFCAFSQYAYSQEIVANPEKYAAHNKGKFFISWGGNRESFSESDIRFWGKDYDFTLHNVVAHDKPKGYNIDYVNPARMTIPQTNLRIGYFISDHYSIALALDHMKYVMFQDRAVNLDGYYPNQGSYGEILPSGKVLLTQDFLTFEHTDGLNYIHVEVARHDDVSKWLGLPNIDKFQVNLTEGLGTGVLLPKTNTKLLGKERHDDFHLSGYGISAKAGINLNFFKHFYVQGEIKTGYINMPDIRTTQSNDDHASQDFFYFQRIISLGGIFKI